MVKTKNEKPNYKFAHGVNKTPSEGVVATTKFCIDETTKKLIYFHENSKKWE